MSEEIKSAGAGAGEAAASGQATSSGGGGSDSQSAGVTTAGQQQASPQNTSLNWKDFRGTLGDLGKEKSLDNVKDLPGLVKNYVEAQKLLGKPVRLPGKEAPEQRQRAINSFLKHLQAEGDIEGTPGSIEQYGISLPTVEGFKVNEPLFNGFKEVFFKNEIPVSKAQKIFDWYINLQKQEEAAKEKEFYDLKSSLKSEYGGLYIRSMEAAKRAVIKYLGTDGEELLSSTALPPKIGMRLVKAFAAIGEGLLEDSSVSGMPAGFESSDSLQAKINKIANDKDHALWDYNKAGHKDAVKEWEQLQNNLSRLQLSQKGRK